MLSKNINRPGKDSRDGLLIQARLESSVTVISAITVVPVPITVIPVFVIPVPVIAVVPFETAIAITFLFPDADVAETIDHDLHIPSVKAESG